MESQPDDGGVAIAKETAAKLGLRLESKFNKWPGLTAALLAGGDLLLHPVFPEGRVPGRPGRMEMELLAGAVVPVARRP